MAGILEQAQQPQQVTGQPGQMPAQADENPNAEGDLSPSALMAQMHVNPQQKQQLERIVAAGKKVMFDKKTHHLMEETMQGDGPPEQKIGGGVVSLLGILWNESKQSLPPELIIPAGVVLVAEATDFLNQTGQTVTPEQIGGATEFMIDTLMKGANVDSNKLAEAGNRSLGVPTQAPPQPMSQQGVAP